MPYLLFCWILLSACHHPALQSDTASPTARNVFGDSLHTCSLDPLTGFYRDGCCHTGREDHGTHVVCATMTAEFLSFTKGRGNDLSTPSPRYSFPGLEPGDRWCLCALRWREAWEADKAPPAHLEATHEKALEYIPLKILRNHAAPAD
jgi:hypothetical protein